MQQKHEPESYIQSTRHEIDRYGHFYISYKWVGPPHGIIGFSRMLLGQVDINQLPWRLKEVDRDHYVIYYVRVDGANLFYYWLTSIRVALRSWSRRTIVRLILTADVWGLADVPLSEEPGWSHIHWGKRNETE